VSQSDYDTYACNQCKARQNPCKARKQGPSLAAMNQQAPGQQTQPAAVYQQATPAVYKPPPAAVYQQAPVAAAKHLGRGSVTSDLKSSGYFSGNKNGINVENKTRHTLCIRIAPNANDTTMVFVQGGIKASATGGGVNGGMQKAFNPHDGIVQHCNLRAGQSTLVATTSDYSYVTVLDGPDGFVVGDENKQVNKGMKMTIVYV